MATGLATRCPACGTVFRVVPDQLRVSEGWVRCGRCSEVFNATQSLVDLDTVVARKAAPPPAPATPPPPAAPPRAPGPAPAEARVEAPTETPVETPAEAQAETQAEMQASAPVPMARVEPADNEPGASRPASFGALDAGPPEDGTAPAAEAPMPDLDFGEDRREPAFDDAASPTPAAAEATEAAAAAVDVPLEAPLEAPLQAPPEPAAEPAQGTPAPPPTVAPPQDIVLPATAVPASAAEDAPAAAAKPDFLRRAERAERWRRPWVRALLGLGVLLGLGGLAGQLLHEYRDLAAARYPQLRPLLEQGCAWLDCRVGAARAIDSLAVESSGLVRVEGSELYRLTVVLRNRAGIPLALPALDLALTDRQGRLIARKVLRPGELGATAETLDAGAETTLAGTLRAANGPVAGYTVELFYP
jgi:predicted Zn finger-like uncharacterized protein